MDLSKIVSHCLSVCLFFGKIIDSTHGGSAGFGRWGWCPKSPVGALGCCLCGFTQVMPNASRDLLLLRLNVAVGSSTLCFCCGEGSMKLGADRPSWCFANWGAGTLKGGSLGPSQMGKRDSLVL